MYGSIVVVLPTEFKSGELIFRHENQEYTYDYSVERKSVPAEEGKSIVTWTAFFSDIEHEVLQVTEGYRVTLIYVSFTIITLPMIQNWDYLI